MNILLIVLGAVLALVLIVLLTVLFGKAKLRIVCQGKLKIVASIFGIRFTLYPEKKKKKKEKESRLLLQCHNPDKVLKKELRIQKKAAKKAQKKKNKARKKYMRKKSKQRKAGLPDPNLLENLQMILALLKKFYKTAKGVAKIEVHQMHITVASNDAATTAVLYGTVVQSAAYILEWIDSHFAEIKRRDGAMTIQPDYLSSTMTSNIDITCTVNLRKGAAIAFEMHSAYKKEKAAALQKAKKRVQNNLAKK